MSNSDGPQVSPKQPGMERRVSMSDGKKTGHCRHMMSVFCDYIDRDLQQRVCRRLERHLRDCPECKLYLDTLKKTVTLYRSMKDPALPRGAQQRLFKTIRLSELNNNNKKHTLTTHGRKKCQ